MISLEAFFSWYLLPLKEELQDIALRIAPLPADFIGILRHYLDEERSTFTPYQIWNRRYVQSMLCLLACEACGGDWQQALPAAAAIELMQTAFLAHDEIRGKDAPQRKASARASWGYAQEINVGDTLFALANLSLGQLCECGVPAKTIVDALYLLNCAGLALSTGQHLHFSLEERGEIAIADYLLMAEGKTALAVYACEVGALIASATDAQRESLHSFGRHLGLAHYLCSSLRRKWDENRNADAVDKSVVGERFWQPGRRDFIEQLAQEQRERAIKALEKGDLMGPAVQALCELAQMPFSSEPLFCLTHDVETLPCL
ncbi:MAG: polyprenyl synthetase family protein [Anaerolineae bacterium]